MNRELPDVVMIRGVQVSKQREGDLMRYTAKGSAGTMITTCLIKDGWKIINLLVDEAEKQICPHCGR